MSIYDPLFSYLKISHLDAITLKFEELEEILGFVLPKSAYKRQAWWGNEDANTTHHSHSKSWSNAGYKVEHADLEERMITFVKK